MIVHEILNPLLDKYEKSYHLLSPGKSNRRVMLQVKKNELKLYDYHDAECRDNVNEVVRELQEQGIIDVKWLSEYLFEEVWLCIENVELAYKLSDKSHPLETAQKRIEMIEKTVRNVSTDWILSWSTDVCEKMRKTLKVSGVCAQEDSLQGILKAFVGYDSIPSDGMTMRAFSAKCYQNTKTFEKYHRTNFIKIAEKYNSELQVLCEDASVKNEDFGVREKMAVLGIYAGAELYELAGDIEIHTARGKICTGAFDVGGIAIPSTNVSSITKFNLSSVEKIIFIENKTNYEAYLRFNKREKELVVYHGGFSSPQKRHFISKMQEIINENNLSIECYLWSDIDIGGFQMFYRLKEIIPSLRPMNMSERDVERFAKAGLERNEIYLSKVKQLLNNSYYTEFKKTIEAILKYKVTIEQEVFLFDENC